MDVIETQNQLILPDKRTIKTEEEMKMDIDYELNAETISEKKFWEMECKQATPGGYFKDECIDRLSSSTKENNQNSSNHVIQKQDVEQLVYERNQMAKIAYDVCCMFMDDKSFGSDQESADSGISEHEEQPEEEKQQPTAKCDEVEVVPKRVTRSQSKVETVQAIEEVQKMEYGAQSMESFLLLNNGFLNKAVLDAVKGTEIGALLNELEQSREENCRLEKYLSELEQRRNALKLHYATTQNLIFQSSNQGAQI